MATIGSIEPTPVKFGLLPPSIQITPAPTTSPTVLPTLVPTLQPTPGPATMVQPFGQNYRTTFVFRYSYYNPKLGGVNCAIFDTTINDCISPMANGLDYHNYYGRAVACPPEIALGTRVEVIYPDALKGEWVCMDRGGAIQGDYIDFLDLAQRYEWSAPVFTYLYPPEYLVVEAPGSH